MDNSVDDANKLFCNVNKLVLEYLFNTLNEETERLIKRVNNGK